MHRRLLIATLLLLVLALIALALAGASTPLRADEATAARPALPGTMSGNLADTKYAGAGARPGPWLDVSPT